jgi:phosphatidylglycerol:prolipoprotein diacylglycerol transferase
MSSAVAVIRIGIDPFIHLGPLTLAWHGLTIALGILAGGVLAGREARRREVDPESLFTMGIILVVAAMVGSRVFYLAEHGQLDDPAKWFGTFGFTFYGGFILVALGLGLYVWKTRLSHEYLDLIAIALPFGYAIGRIGDIINGEHYGPSTDFFLGVVNTHPESDVPNHAVAYHNGGLYESLIGLVVFVLIWPLRRRFKRPLTAVWAVLALFAIARFFEFFVRSDSAPAALGLETAQWTSVGLLLIAASGAMWSRRHFAAPRKSYSA